MQPQSLNIEGILAKAKQTWEQEQTRARPIQERIGESVPWWLVIVAAVMFTLSVPHTIQVFTSITPIFGVVAPLGLEFGLLYAAFFRKTSQGNKVLVLFEVVLIVASIVANFAGSLMSVADNVGLKTQSWDQIWGSLRTLPVNQQVPLLLVPFAAIMIPAGTWVAGEGLAKLFLDRRERVQDLSAAWKLAAPKVEYQALYNAAIMSGMNAADSRTFASEYVMGRHYRVRTRPRPDSPERTPSGHLDTGTPDRLADSLDKPVDNGADKSKSEVIRNLFKVRPELLSTPDRDLADQTGISKTLINEVKKEFRSVQVQTGNGHSHEAIPDNNEGEG